MSIDNLPLIKPLLTFRTDDDFYYLQILQRKKEHPELGSNSRVVRNYYIPSIEYLEKRYDEIQKLCDAFQARASLRLNVRSKKNVAFKTMVNIANTMANGEYQFVSKCYDRASGQSHNASRKLWILDIDNYMEPHEIQEIVNFMYNQMPSGVNKLVAQIPSLSGVHLITTPFDLRYFPKEFPKITVHKDNPTNLYIP